MLVSMGILLGLVLLVMLGEQAQQTQVANWLPTTTIPALERVMPSWMCLWFGVLSTPETPWRSFSRPCSCSFPTVSSTSGCCGLAAPRNAQPRR
jgi:hypothetical protein